MNLSDSKIWRFGEAYLEVLGSKEMTGNSAGSMSTGQVQIYQATISKGIKLLIGDITWKTKDREVKFLSCSTSTHRSLRRLCNGLRLGVKNLDKDTLWVELSQARIDSEKGMDCSNLYKATMVEFTDGAGISVQKVLENFGAKVDKREQLLGDAGRRRSYLCAAFPKAYNHLPAICYVLTRILPLTRRLGILRLLVFLAVVALQRFCANNEVIF